MSHRKTEANLSVGWRFVYKNGVRGYGLWCKKCHSWVHSKAIWNDSYLRSVLHNSFTIPERDQICSCRNSGKHIKLIWQQVPKRYPLYAYIDTYCSNLYIYIYIMCHHNHDEGWKQEARKSREEEEEFTTYDAYPRFHTISFPSGVTILLWGWY